MTVRQHGHNHYYHWHVLDVPFPPGVHVLPNISLYSISSLLLFPHITTTTTSTTLCSLACPMGKLSDILSKDRSRLQASKHAGQTSSISRPSSTGAGPVLPLYQTGIRHADVAFELNDQRNGGNKATGPAHSLSGVDAAAGHDDKPSNPILLPTAPPVKSSASGPGDTTLNSDQQPAIKPPFKVRIRASSKRFIIHSKNALFHSWMNVLLVFVPAGIVVRALHVNAAVVFALNAIAIVPLAGLLTYATESVARRLGDTLGALLNVSFGNAVELIIFIIALAKNEIRIVQASLLGSILSNLLLILGMAFLLGGLRYREQIYNSTVTQMSACLLSLSVMSLLLPVSHVKNLFRELPPECDLFAITDGR